MRFRPTQFPLTGRQREILDWIQAFRDREGMPPTVREIGAAFGLRSTGSVRSHLEALARKGWLKAGSRRRHRGLRLGKVGSPGLRGARPSGPLLLPGLRQVPILGRVAAGPMLLAEQNLEGSLALDAGLLPRSGEVFALRVRGDSMVGAGILDGDLALVRRQETAEPGEIVVAMLDGEATVKRFRPGPEGIRLEPENPAFRPIVVAPDSGDFRILGRLAGVVRKC